MLTQTNFTSATVDHAGDFRCRKQLRPTHFAASLATLGSLASQSRALFDFIDNDKCDDFTSQFLVNRAVSHCRP